MLSRVRLHCFFSVGTGVILAAGCPQTRTDSRAVISGRVALVDVAGANDMSRVRVDLGRGEGGITPDAEGNFEISDLEPDVYNVAVTYIGGLEDAATGSAYAPWTSRLVARAGSSSALGVIQLPLGTGSVRGAFTRSDSGPLGGMTVKLLGGSASLETVSPDGTFSFAAVPVGRYQLLVQRDGVAGDCGRALVVGAHAQEVVLAAATVEPSAVSFTPASDNGVSQAFSTNANHWFLRFDHVVVLINAPGARKMRSWSGTDGGAGALVAVPASLDVTGVAANAQTQVNFQFEDACGLQTPVQTLHLVRDTQPPTALATLNNGNPYASSATMVLQVIATDELSMPLRLQKSVCNEDVCVPASLAAAPFEDVLPVSQATFNDTDGRKSVKLRITDGSNNSVDLQATATLEARLDRIAPSNVVITVLESDGMVGTATRVHSPHVKLNVTADGVQSDGNRTAQIRMDVTNTFANGPWANFTNPSHQYELDTGLQNGTASIYVQLRDPAGNETAAFEVPIILDHSASLFGSVLLEGRTAFGGVTVSVLGTTHQATTDDAGAFLIPGVPAGRYTVEVRAPGFRTARVAGTDVVPPLGTDLGIVELTASRGRVAGTVRLEGRTGHGGVDVVLPLDAGGEVRTVSDGAGAFSFAMGPGTYNGDVRATFPPNFSPATFTTPIVVQEDQVFNMGELLLNCIANDLSGTVSVEGAAVELTEIAVFGEAGTPTEGVAPAPVLAGTNGSWSVTGLPLGLYRIHVRNTSVVGLEEAWRAGILVDKGNPTVVPLVALRKRFVTINNGDLLTRTSTVDLSLANATDCLEVEISNVVGFTPATRESCRAGHVGWPLAAGQGLKTVYVRYYTVGSPTVPTAVVTDDITVDSVAAISAFSYSPTTNLRMGTLVTFVMDTGEPGGTATASIGTYVQGLVLRDDGLNGDGAANDGRYGLRYTVDIPSDVVNARVDGNFRDAAGNVAPLRSATPNMNVAVPPLITNILVGVDTQTRQVTISWTTDENTTGSVRYGADTTYALGTLNTSGPAGKTWSVLINAATLTPGAPYHFLITATDTAGNATLTNDRTFYFKPSTPLFVAAIPGDGTAWVRWEGPDQRGILGFHVYRSLVEAGPYTRLTTAPYNHEVNVYQDNTVTNATEYFYQVTTVDGSGNESAPSYAHSATPGGNTGPTPVAGVLRGINVWSSRGSPYTVSGDIQVETNAVPGEAPALLVIGPGTEVHFLKGSGSARSTMAVSGRIAVLGARGPMVPDGQGGMVESDAGMVVFKSAEAVPAKGDWDGVDILAVSAPGTLDMAHETGIYQSGSVFHRVEMSRGGAGGGMIRAARSAVALTPSALYVSRCRLSEAFGGLLHTTTREVVIRDSEFFSAGNPNTNVVDVVGSSQILLERLRVHDLGGMAVAVSDLVTVAGATSRWRDAYGVFRDSTVERSARGGVNLGAYMRGVDLTVRQATGDTAALTGAGTVTRSVVEDSDMGASNLNTAYMTFRGNRQTIMSGSAWGNDVVDSGCPVGATCAANLQDISASSDVIKGNIVSETTPHSRSAVVVLGIGSGGAIGVAEYNHILLPGTAYPLIKTMRFGARFNRNSILSNPATTLSLIDCTAPYSVDAMGNPTKIDVQNNFWGAAVNAAMLANPRANQTFVHDYWDSPSALAEMNYSPPLPDPYPLARISAPWWGQRFYEGDTITFTATGSDPVEGPLNPATFAWLTSSGTPLGSGGTITSATFTADHTGGATVPPRRKVHTVEVAVRDAAMNEIRMPVEFEVWPAP